MNTLKTEKTTKERKWGRENKAEQVSGQRRWVMFRNFNGFLNSVSTDFPLLASHSYIPRNLFFSGWICSYCLPPAKGQKPRCIFFPVSPRDSPHTKNTRQCLRQTLSREISEMLYCDNCCIPRSWAHNLKSAYGITWSFLYLKLRELYYVPTISDLYIWVSMYMDLN